jgi:predicted nuclease of predicted toxin-antitoxin system
MPSLIARYRFNPPREVPRRPEPITATCSTAVRSGPRRCAHLERGLEQADDDVLLDVARDEQRIVISGDTDFGALLALARQKSPSVILFRSRHHRTAEQQAAVILEHLDDLAGAAKTVQVNKLYY